MKMLIKIQFFIRLVSAGLLFNLLLPQAVLAERRLQFIAPKSGFSNTVPVIPSDLSQTFGQSILSQSKSSGHSGILQDSFLTHSLMQETPKETKIPRSIHRYHIKEKLGHGAMGPVYRVFDSHLNRHVALKLVSIEHKSPRAIARFLREAAIASRLKHPHLAHLLDFGILTEEGLFYYTMEEYEGGTLKSFSEKTGPFSPRSAIKYILQALKGLDYLHYKGGIVHRDIKPGNLLLRKNHSVVLADYSLSKSSDDATLTHTRDMIGTPYTMSPEQITPGEAPPDTRSDIYSMGVVLYYLLTGKYPFEGKNLEELKNAISKGKPARLEIPPGLWEIILKAISIQREKRFQTAQEMIDALEQFKRGEKPNAPQPKGWLEWLGIPTLTWQWSLKRIEEDELAARPHLDRGEMFLTQGNLGKAIGEFRAAVRHGPYVSEAHLKYGLAMIQSHIRKNPNPKWQLNSPVLRHLSRAIELNPNSFRALLERGKLYLEINWTELALRDFQIAAAIRPQDEQIHQLLSRAYINLGNEEKALQERQKAKKIGEQGKTPKRVKTVIYDFLENSLYEEDEIIEMMEILESHPQTIGEYKILDILGIGGMGTVYRAQRQVKHEDRTVFTRLVALKFISMNASKEEKKLFQKEIDTLKDLESIGIVKIYDTGEHNGRLFYVMELINGRTLFEEMRERKIPPREAARILYNVTHLVTRIHSQGYIHRDLKPQNIMLDPDSETTRIIDFGIARKEELSRFIQKEPMVGTPAYMSPEQVRGSPATKLSDVYSLGATLYELLTGRPPYRGDSVAKVLEKVRQGQLKPPVEINPLIPRELNAIVMRAMAFKPRNRYPSAIALREDLHRYLNGDPVTAQPESWIRKKSRQFWNALRPVSEREKRALRESATPYYEAGEILMERRELDGAYWHFLRAVEIDSSYSEAFLKLGLVQIKREEHQKAFQSLNRSLEWNPNSPQALLERGKLLLKEGKFSRAQEDFEAALKLHNDIDEAMVALGIAQLDYPTFDHSIALFSKALLLNPDNHLAAIMLLYVEQLASKDQVVAKWKPAPLKIELLPEEWKSEAQFYFDLLKKKRKLELTQEEIPEELDPKKQVKLTKKVTQEIDRDLNEILEAARELSKKGYLTAASPLLETALRFYANNAIRSAAIRGLHRLIERYKEIDLKEADIEATLNLPVDQLVQRVRFLRNNKLLNRLDKSTLNIIWNRIIEAPQELTPVEEHLAVEGLLYLTEAGFIGEMNKEMLSLIANHLTLARQSGHDPRIEALKLLRIKAADNSDSLKTIDAEQKSAILNKIIKLIETRSLRKTALSTLYAMLLCDSELRHLSEDKINALLFSVHNGTPEDIYLITKIIYLINENHPVLQLTRKFSRSEFPLRELNNIIKSISDPLGLKGKTDGTNRRFILFRKSYITVNFLNKTLTPHRFSDKDFSLNQWKIIEFALEINSIEIQREIFNKLRKIKPQPRVISYLLEKLTGLDSVEESEYWEEILKLLADWKVNKAVPILKGFLESHSGIKGNPDVTNPVPSFTTDDRYISVIHTLAKIGSTEAISVLLEALDHFFSPIRVEVEKVLLKLALDNEHRNLLKEILKSSGAPFLTARRLLSEKLQRLAEIDSDTFNFESAEQCLLAAVDIEPDNLYNHLMLAMTYHNMKNRDQVLAHLKLASEIDPSIQDESFYKNLIKGTLPIQDPHFNPGDDSIRMIYPVPYKNRIKAEENTDDPIGISATGRPETPEATITPNYAEQAVLTLPPSYHSEGEQDEDPKDLKGDNPSSQSPAIETEKEDSGAPPEKAVLHPEKQIESNQPEETAGEADAEPETESLQKEPVEPEIPESEVKPQPKPRAPLDELIRRKAEEGVSDEDDGPERKVLLEGDDNAAVGKNCYQDVHHFRVNQLIEFALKEGHFISIDFNKKIHLKTELQQELTFFMMEVIRYFGKRGDDKAITDISGTEFIFLKPKAISSIQTSTLLWFEKTNGFEKFQVAHAGTGGNSAEGSPRLAQKVYLSFGLIYRLMIHRDVSAAALILKHEARHARERKVSKIKGPVQTEEDLSEVRDILERIKKYIEEDLLIGIGIENQLNIKTTDLELRVSSRLEASL